MVVSWSSTRSQGIGVRECSPFSPVKPNSSPANTTGIPGSETERPSATGTAPARARVTKREVS